MTGLQKTKAIGRLAMKTAQAICKSLPLEGDYYTIYTGRMTDENPENNNLEGQRLADTVSSIMADPSDPRYKGAVGIEMALEFHIAQETKGIEQCIANIDKAKLDLKHFQSGLADHYEDHAEALGKLNNVINDVENSLSEIIPVSVYPNLIVEGDDAEIYDEGAAEDFQDALDALSYKETQKVVLLQNQIRNLRQDRAKALQWDKQNIEFHQLGIDKCNEIISEGGKVLDQRKKELARLLSLRPEDGYFAHKKEQEEQRKNDAKVAELQRRQEATNKMHVQEVAELIERAERAERAEALLRSEMRKTTPAQRAALEERADEERLASYKANENKPKREIEFKKQLPFIVNWIRQAAEDKQPVRLLLRGWKPKQSIFLRSGIDVDESDVIHVVVRGHYRANLAKIEFIQGKHTGKFAILAIGFDENKGVNYVLTCFHEDDRWETEEIKVMQSIHKTKGDRLTNNQRLKVRSAVLEKINHGLNTDLVGATMINPVTSIVLGD